MSAEACGKAPWLLGLSCLVDGELEGGGADAVDGGGDRGDVEMTLAGGQVKVVGDAHGAGRFDHDERERAVVRHAGIEQVDSGYESAIDLDVSGNVHYRLGGRVCRRESH